MLEGETASVRITDIIINRDHRLRRDIKPEKIEALADSISRLGLMHYPIITRDNILVAGENRLAALTLLGWDRCTVTWADTVDENELLAIELEENVKRTDLSWQEQCDAVRRYHDLQSVLHETWSHEETADNLGIARSVVTEYIQVAKAVRAGDARVIAAPRLSTAKNIVKRANSRRMEDEAVALAAVDGGEPIAPEPASPIITGDFKEWSAGYTGSPFNLLHCDFPYGINAERFNQSAGAELGSYRDDFATYRSLLDTLEYHRAKLMGTSCHCIFWFSMQHYDYTLQRLRAIFTFVDPYPLVWFKSDNKGTLPDPNRGPRRVYEVAFLCSVGDRKIVAPVSNVFAGPTVRSGDHMSEKSQAMLEHFFRMVVDGGTRLLDPTAGSGSAIRAADKLGAASVLGLERDSEFAANARRAWDIRNA